MTVGVSRMATAPYLAAESAAGERSNPRWAVRGRQQLIAGVVAARGGAVLASPGHVLALQHALENRAVARAVSGSSRVTY
jgi:hypothetical protein